MRAKPNTARGFPDRAHHDCYTAEIANCYIISQAKSARGYAAGMICSHTAASGQTKNGCGASKMLPDRETELKQEAEKSLAGYRE